MALDASKVLIGLAEQSATTGAISQGEVVETIPTTMDEALAAAASFTSAGYVSEDGLSLSTDYSTTDVKEWNGATVRKLLESFDGTLSWTYIQVDADSCIQAFGEENVDIDGDKIHIKLGSHLPEAKSWCFRMKDGDKRIVIFVPRGQVTAVDEISFMATEVIGFPITLSCYDDGTGESIHIFIEDSSEPGPTPPTPTEPSITLNQHTANLTVGGTRQLTATTVPADAEVTWGTLDDSVATVADGLVTAVGVGTTDIEASIVVDGQDYLDTCTVNVTE